MEPVGKKRPREMADELELAEPVEIPPLKPLAEATVDDERPCARCGYILRGLSTAGRCPECGTPIADSLGDDALAHSDWRWLERVSHGILVVMVGAVLMPVAWFAWGSTGNPLVGAGLACGAGALDLLGIWMMTQVDPRASTVGDQMPRAGLFVVAAIVLAVVLIAVASGVWLGTRSALWSAEMIITLGYAVRAWFYYKVLRAYARRMPDSDWGVHCTALAWTLPVVYLALAGSAALAGMAPAGLDTLLLCPASVLALSLGIWALVVNMKVIEGFSAAARIARRHAGVDHWP